MVRIGSCTVRILGCPNFLFFLSFSPFSPFLRLCLLFFSSSFLPLFFLCHIVSSPACFGISVSSDLVPAPYFLPLALSCTSLVTPLSLSDFRSDQAIIPAATLIACRSFFPRPQHSSAAVLLRSCLVIVDLCGVLHTSAQSSPVAPPPPSSIPCFFPFPFFQSSSRPTYLTTHHYGGACYGALFLLLIASDHRPCCLLSIFYDFTFDTRLAFRASASVLLRPLPSARLIGRDGSPGPRGCLCHCMIPVLLFFRVLSARLPLPHVHISLHLSEVNY